MTNEDTLWISNINPGNVHGHPIKKLNNVHLANIIHFFRINDQQIHGHPDEECGEIIVAMIIEAEKRGLTREFLDGAPYPYDPNAPYVEYSGPRKGSTIRYVEKDPEDGTLIF